MMLYVWTKTKKMVDSGTVGKFAYAIRKYNEEKKQNENKRNMVYFFINTV